MIETQDIRELSDMMKKFSWISMICILKKSNNIDQQQEVLQFIPLHSSIIESKHRN